jgi:hypothetical protein
MRKYNLYEDHHKYDTVDAEDADAALEVAKENVDRSNYDFDPDEPQKTIWIRVEARRVEACTSSDLEDDKECADPECPEHENRVEAHSDCASAKVQLDPEEPPCGHKRHPNPEGHDWQSPHEVVGGLKENPGVQGHGGGVTIEEVCARCGTYKVTDTWAQDMTDGEQGLTSTAYRDSDECSEEWVESLKSDPEDEMGVRE